VSLGGRGIDNRDGTRDHGVLSLNLGSLLLEVLNEGISVLGINEGEANPLLVTDGENTEAAHGTTSIAVNRVSGDLATTHAAERSGLAVTDDSLAKHAAAIREKAAMGPEGHTYGSTIEILSPVTIKVVDGRVIHHPHAAGRGVVGLNVIIIDSGERILLKSSSVADSAGAGIHAGLNKVEAAHTGGRERSVVDKLGSLANLVLRSDSGGVNTLDETVFRRNIILSTIRSTVVRRVVSEILESFHLFLRNLVGVLVHLRERILWT